MIGFPATWEEADPGENLQKEITSDPPVKVGLETG